MWDWGEASTFAHDELTTDKRNPTLYSYGKVYGVDRTGGGRLLVLDPMKNAVSWLQVEPRDKSHGYSLTKDYYHGAEENQAYTGEDAEWMASPHNPMFDEKGRVFTSETYRYRTSVLDIRHYMFMLEDDLAARNVDDRIAYSKKWFGDKFKDLSIETEVVRVLEDRTGSGQANFSAVYADKFNTPLDGIASGTLAHHGKVYFANIPNVWELSGMDKADRRG